MQMPEPNRNGVLSDKARIVARLRGVLPPTR